MLYIVATPIGNLEDISLRALRILKEVDLILCEDTRVTRKLLDTYQIKNKKLESYHQHTSQKKVDKLLGLIKENQVALVTDAGTPGISDPGNKLISALVGTGLNLSIVSIPGASAVTAALSVSGFPTDNFLFKGFIPHKNKRQKFLKEIIASKVTTIFYESPHRILKCLEQLEDLCRDRSRPVQLVICRELTKKFETIYRGTAQEILKQIKKEFKNKKIKGEFVVIVA